VIRAVAAAALLASLGGCAGVPAAIVWSTVGAGLGYVASVNAVGLELLKREEPAACTAPPVDTATPVQE
jgi:hypothetical protein